MKQLPLITVRHPGAGPDHPYYTLTHEEGEGSRLQYEAGVGTILNTALPREFEFVIRERDSKGYCGLAGNFEATPENWPKALEYLFNLAGLTLNTPPAFKGEFRTT